MSAAPVPIAAPPGLVLGEGERILCRLEEIEDGGAKGFPAPPGRFMGFFLVRQGEAVFAYVNSCPHIGVPLEWVPDQFLDARREFIQCSTHNAFFRIADGYCIGGPCAGESLEMLPARVAEGLVILGAEPED